MQHVEREASCIPTPLCIAKTAFGFTTEHEKQRQEDAKVPSRGIHVVGQASSLPITPLNSQNWKQIASRTQEKEETLTF